MASTVTSTPVPPAFVRYQLVLAGLEELASVDSWDEDDRRFFVAIDAVLETYVIPVGQIERLSAATRRELPTRQARAGRDHGLFREGEALTLDTTEDAAVAQSDRGEHAVSGVAISAKRSVTVWSALSTQ